ncbi:hypothetical protein P4S72_12815 [Vibrio sp. PP-XX7]
MIESIQAELKDPEQRQDINDIESIVHQYQEAFDQVVALTAQQKQIYQGTLVKHTASLEEALSQLRKLDNGDQHDGSKCWKKICIMRNDL